MKFTQNLFLVSLFDRRWLVLFGSGSWSGSSVSFVMARLLVGSRSTSRSTRRSLCRSRSTSARPVTPVTPSSSSSLVVVVVAAVTSRTAPGRSGPTPRRTRPASTSTMISTTRSVSSGRRPRTRSRSGSSRRSLIARCRLLVELLLVLFATLLGSTPQKLHILFRLLVATHLALVLILIIVVVVIGQIQTWLRSLQLLSRHLLLLVLEHLFGYRVHFLVGYFEQNLGHPRFDELELEWETHKLKMNSNKREEKKNVSTNN